ncbi:MAG TPA: ABC transporter ATP-binding protein [Firmicutes bacterium]|nr:ABC transporter ATP-binding protein [Bacillota bacterium]
MKNIIEIKNLSKSFGEVKAVDNLSFSVKEGELFAFLGVNGAGKSTTINIICGCLAADGGTVTVDGHDACRDEAVKNAIGVVFQNSLLDKSLTVADNLASRAALYGISGEGLKRRVAELAEMLDFGGLLGRTVGKLSGGQRRRVDIARALIHKPKILILDEPTTGLDPQTRKTLWAVIGNLREKEKMTALLTTHYMEEAAGADYVVIIDGGRVAAEGTPLELKNAYTGDFITLYGVSRAEAESLGVPFVSAGDAFVVEVPDTAAATKLITEHPGVFRDYEITKGGMDDVFLNVTGKKAEERH